MKLLANLLGIFLLSASSFSVAYSQSLNGTATRAAQQRKPQASQLIEQFSFSLPDFKMDHQGEVPGNNKHNQRVRSSAIAGCSLQPVKPCHSFTTTC